VGKVPQWKRGGAAGGTATALRLFCNATLISGAEWILNILEFQKHLEGADLLIVGEGRLDVQTVHQKAPIIAAKQARALHVPVIALVGSVLRNYSGVYEQGIDAVLPVSFVELHAPPEHALSLLADAAEQLARIVKLI